MFAGMVPKAIFPSVPDKGVTGRPPLSTLCVPAVAKVARLPGSAVRSGERPMSSRFCLAVGSVLAGLAVALGAFAAHGLDGFLLEKLCRADPRGPGTRDSGGGEVPGGFQTARRVPDDPRLGDPGRRAVAGTAQLPLGECRRLCFIGGIAVFSGGLYALVVSGVRVLGAIVPIGGVLFLVGWGCSRLRSCGARRTRAVTGYLDTPRLRCEFGEFAGTNSGRRHPRAARLCRRIPRRGIPSSCARPLPMIARVRGPSGLRDAKLLDACNLTRLAATTAASQTSAARVRRVAGHVRVLERSRLRRGTYGIVSLAPKVVALEDWRSGITRGNGSWLLWSEGYGRSRRRSRLSTTIRAWRGS